MKTKNIYIFLYLIYLSIYIICWLSLNRHYQHHHGRAKDHHTQESHLQSRQKMQEQTYGNTIIILYNYIKVIGGHSQERQTGMVSRYFFRPYSRQAVKCTIVKLDFVMTDQNPIGKHKSINNCQPSNSWKCTHTNTDSNYNIGYHKIVLSIQSSYLQ